MRILEKQLEIAIEALKDMVVYADRDSAENTLKILGIEFYPSMFQKLVKQLESEEKARQWMVTENPHLGNCSPIHLIAIGRGHKVEQFIDSVIAEDEWGA